MKNDLLIEINSTLEQIQEVNQMLAFHKQFEEPDTNAINNFVTLREDFIRQLQVLMRNFSIDVKYSQAA